MFGFSHILNVLLPNEKKKRSEITKTLNFIKGFYFIYAEEKTKRKKRSSIAVSLAAWFFFPLSFLYVVVEFVILIIVIF